MGFSIGKIGASTPVFKGFEDKKGEDKKPKTAFSADIGSWLNGTAGTSGGQKETSASGFVA